MRILTDAAEDKNGVDGAFLKGILTDENYYRVIDIQYYHYFP